MQITEVSLNIGHSMVYKGSILLIKTEVLFTKEISGVYISPFSDKDELNRALWAGKVSGAFEKRAPDPQIGAEIIPNRK